MKKLFDKLVEYSKISFTKFIYYNYFCKQVHRTKNAYLIPYHGSAIRLRKGAAIYMSGNLLLNIGRTWNVGENSYLLLDKDAELHIKEKMFIAYGSRIVLGPGARMKVGSMGCGMNCMVVCLNSIIMGEQVMLGWNVTVMDGNGHPVGYEGQQTRENTKPVIIGNHVWLCNGCHVMKGSKIGDGAIIGARSFISGRVKAGAMTSPMPTKVIMEDVGWNG